ncbi:MAG: (d)CMP kinase [Infirmifilum sp.]|uniref:(d)CMP kinase n=1 Tax=Infirmifilum uzonense TaxID=1550241 RepID=UPI003C743E20
MPCVVIAVSGTPGSGKTTYSRFISEYYGLRYVSSGHLFREIARERGIDFLQLHREAEKNMEIDMLIDQKAIIEALYGGVVVEGHLAVWVLKDIAHIKVIFDAPREVRAERIAKRDGISFEEALEEIIQREKSNYERALKYYGLNIRDYSVADLVVSTQHLPPEAIKRVVSTYIDAYREKYPQLFA